LVAAVARVLAGANLLLILLDMSRARSAGDRLATTTVHVRRPTLEPAAQPVAAPAGDR
jgi:hypothetical protein